MNKAEKRWIHTQLVVHKEIYRHLKNALTKEIILSKKRFMQDKIASAVHSQKALFQCVDELLYKSKKQVFPSNIPLKELPDKFCQFFIDKVSKIQQKFTNSNDTMMPRTPFPIESQLQILKPATHEEIRKLIIASPTKSCSLDPIPTFLLKDCIDDQ